mgnify:CR=1 FL=1
MAEHVRVRVKRERTEDATPAATACELSSEVWEKRFQRLAAIAFDHGVPLASIAEIEEAVKSDGEPAHNSILWLGRRVQIEGKAGAGCVRFVGKTAFADGLWFGIAMDEAVGKHDGVVDGTHYFCCQVNHGLMVPASSGKVKPVKRAAERAAAAFHSGKVIDTAEPGAAEVDASIAAKELGGTDAGADNIGSYLSKASSSNLDKAGVASKADLPYGVVAGMLNMPVFFAGKVAASRAAEMARARWAKRKHLCFRCRGMHSLTVGCEHAEMWVRDLTWHTHIWHVGDTALSDLIRD